MQIIEFVGLAGSGKSYLLQGIVRDRHARRGWLLPNEANSRMAKELLKASNHKTMYGIQLACLFPVISGYAERYAIEVGLKQENVREFLQENHEHFVKLMKEALHSGIVSDQINPFGAMEILNSIQQKIKYLIMYKLYLKDSTIVLDQFLFQSYFPVFKNHQNQQNVFQVLENQLTNYHILYYKQNPEVVYKRLKKRSSAKDVSKLKNRSEPDFIHFLDQLSSEYDAYIYSLQKCGIKVLRLDASDFDVNKCNAIEYLQRLTQQYYRS